MNTIKKLFFAMIIMIAYSSPANAEIMHNQTVFMTGTAGDGTNVYVGVIPNSAQCIYNGIYFYETTEMAQALSIAISAKISGQVVRVDFIKNTSTGFCYGTGIYLE